MENDEEKIRSAYDMIKSVYLPKQISVNKLLIGVSESGKLGSYRVIKEINI